MLPVGTHILQIAENLSKRCDTAAVSDASLPCKPFADSETRVPLVCNRQLALLHHLPSWSTINRRHTAENPITVHLRRLRSAPVHRRLLPYIP
jgi:hypothetical protein